MRKSIRKQFTRQQFISEVLIPARNAVDSLPCAIGTVDYSDFDPEWGVQTVTMSHAEYMRQLRQPWRTWTDPAGSGESFCFDDEASEELYQVWFKAVKRWNRLVGIYYRCWKTPLSQWICLS